MLKKKRERKKFFYFKLGWATGINRDGLRDCGSKARVPGHSTNLSYLCSTARIPRRRSRLPKTPYVPSCAQEPINPDLSRFETSRRLARRRVVRDRLSPRQWQDGLGSIHGCFPRPLRLRPF